VDSIAAVFGVTRDPFIVYSSNVCAILGLRALYFLLAGILQYFQYLDEGLAITVMFIGAKMLANPWVHISTGLSLAIVGGIIALAILISVIRAKPQAPTAELFQKKGRLRSIPPPTAEDFHRLADQDPEQRAQAAQDLYCHGKTRTLNWLDEWSKDDDFRPLIVQDQYLRPDGEKGSWPKITVGIAVLPETFEKIRTASGSPPLADAPADQDVVEFELEFAKIGMSHAHLDVLTTKTPGGNGAIARFLKKFGEGIQQIEIDVTNVDLATEILRTRFEVAAIYPATRPGANGTRVNFFLVTAWNNQKVLVELVEQPKGALK
jgi:integral membrane protein TerC family protein